ncbi:hypothetical protein A9Q99_12785 [Gammaproteobacteria bacterium 45_16_T64]|nr:hypothetical protein A9Q99_12785 [Gammaproteobacteria bacterium 45_16_T64]
MKALLLTLFWLSCVSVYAHSPHIVTLSTKASWPPYHKDIDPGADGIAVRAVACIMARINQPFTINKVPWARAQGLTKEGKSDGFFSASQNDVRDSYAAQSDVFIPQTRAFYTLKQHVPIAINNYDVEYIRAHMTVSARFASNALKSLEKDNFSIAGKPKSEDLLFRMINANRVGAILENTIVFRGLLEKHQRKIDDYVEIIYQTKNMGVYFSLAFLTSHPTFLSAFNRHIPPCSLLPINSMNSVQ